MTKETARESICQIAKRCICFYAAIYICLNYETYLSIMQTISILKIKMKTQQRKKRADDNRFIKVELPQVSHSFEFV